MTTKQREKLFSKAYNAYINETELNQFGGVNRRSLSLYDYNCIFEILKEFNKPNCNSVWTFIESVAFWFKKKGFVVYEPQPDRVKQNPKFINYWIGYDKEDYPDDM